MLTQGAVLPTLPDRLRPSKRERGHSHDQPHQRAPFASNDGVCIGAPRGACFQDMHGYVRLDQHRRLLGVHRACPVVLGGSRRTTPPCGHHVPRPRPGSGASVHDAHLRCYSISAHSAEFLIYNASTLLHVTPMVLYISGVTPKPMPSCRQIDTPAGTTRSAADACCTSHALLVRDVTSDIAPPSSRDVVAASALR